MKEIIAINQLAEVIQKLHNTPYKLGDDTFYPVEIHILTHFREQEDLGVARLSQVLEVSKSAVSQKVKRLIEKGYLVLNEQSGRRKTYILTSKGYKICEYHDRIGNAMLEELMAGLSLYSDEERAVFTRITENLTEGLKTFEIDAEIRKVVKHAD